MIKSLTVSPLLLRPAPIFPFCASPDSVGSSAGGDFSMADVRLSPHYPVQPPLSDIFRTIPPGSDEFPLEKFAVEIESLLDQWGGSLKQEIAKSPAIATLLDDHIDVSDLDSATQITLRSGFGVDAVKRTFARKSKISREQFLHSLAQWLGPATSIETAEFEIFSIKQTDAAPLTLQIELRYDIVSNLRDQKHEERVGTGRMLRWITHASSGKAKD